LTDEPTVVEASADYRFWALLLPVSGVGAFIWDGIFIGCTKTRGMLLSMFFAAVTFFAVFFSLRSLWGNHALWLAFILYMSARGVAQSLLWNGRKKQSAKQRA
jgi:multidrug resistance protein, MATE family